MCIIFLYGLMYICYIHPYICLYIYICLHIDLPGRRSFFTVLSGGRRVHGHDRACKIIIYCAYTVYTVYTVYI